MSMGVGRAVHFLVIASLNGPITKGHLNGHLKGYPQRDTERKDKRPTTERGGQRERYAPAKAETVHGSETTARVVTR
jgi:hypothetical protein